MLTIKKLLLFFVAILSIAASFSQVDSTTKDKKNIIIASLNYQSKLHYFGRVDSLESSGLFPSIGFELKNGLYATGNFIFIQNSLQPTAYTGTTIEAGYRFPESEHFTGNVFYTHFLYKDNSELVQSALKGQTGINAAYTNKIVNLNIGADLKFSDKTDVGATFGLDHLFIKKIKEGMAFAFNPSAYVYAGTQQFSNTYVKNTSPILGLPTTGQTVTEQITSFNVLAYEFSAPIVFVAGKFNASVTPSYVLPQQLIPGENGKNLFYISLGIGVRL
jgi:hypothetical protein